MKMLSCGYREHNHVVFRITPIFIKPHFTFQSKHKKDILQSPKKSLDFLKDKTKYKISSAVYFYKYIT